MAAGRADPPRGSSVGTAGLTADPAHPHRRPVSVRLIQTVKTARYVVLGDEEGPVREVWLAVHGYGQLGEYFARHFRAIAQPGRLVVVPEAPSRFYADDESGRYSRVGASWMTRELREHDVADTVRFLDDVLVAATARADVDLRTVPLAGVGFSQGTSVLVRWLALSPLARQRAARVQRLVLWGGGMPHDLDLAPEHDWLHTADLTLVAGDRDAIATPARVMEQEARLTAAGIPHLTVSFSGEHRMNERVLAGLGGPLTA